MTRSESLLEKMLEQLSELNEKVGRQEARLEEHMRRTEVAETNIANIAETIKPVQAHVAMVEGSLKVLGVIGGILAFIIGTGITTWSLFVK